jgi:hypothetical protein
MYHQYHQMYTYMHQQATWYKTILNQLCTIGTNKYMYHKWKNHTAFSFIEKEYFYHSLDVSVKNSANPFCGTCICWY